jgi:formylglycine-generating enzyme
MLEPDRIGKLVAVLDCRSDRFNVLVRASGLRPGLDFKGADLRATDLRGEDMAHYGLRGADLSGADIRGTDFSRTSGLATAGFAGAIADAGTRWPPNLHIPGIMVLIPPGSFIMGVTVKEQQREKVPQEYREQERPRHKVIFARGFYLGRYPVTVGEFARFVAESSYSIPQGAYTYVQGKGWEQSGSHDWSDPGFPQTDRHPVTCVSHEDASAYAQWLSDRTGKQYRLPTETEWEYACRAGTTTARFWGDDRDGAKRYANVADRSLACEFNAAPHPERYFDFDDGFAFTSPVGSFGANPFGLHDVLGNVWEWMQDHWHDNYKNAPDGGAASTTGGSEGLRVVRGGSWYYDPWVVRAGSRIWLHTGDRGTDTGFRLARTLSHLES